MVGYKPSISQTGEIKNYLRTLWNSKKFSDVTLVCDDLKWLKAHKVILSVCSSYFKDILSKNDDEDETIIYLQGTQYKDLMAVLQYMYCGEAFNSYTNIQALKDIAKNLRIYQLLESINEYETETFVKLFTPQSQSPKKEKIKAAGEPMPKVGFDHF